MEYAIDLKEDALLPEVLKDFWEKSFGEISRNAQERQNHADRLKIRTPGIRGQLRNIYLTPEMSLSVVDMDCLTPFHFEMDMAIPGTTEFSFNLQGSASSWVGIPNRKKSLEHGRYEGQFEVSATKEGDINFAFDVPPGQHMRMVEITCDGEALENMCSATGFTLPSRLVKKAEEAVIPIASCASIIPASLEQVLEVLAVESLENPLDDSEGNTLFLEEMSLDVCRELSSLLSGSLPEEGTLLSPGDLEKIREAHTILESRMSSPPRLMELARMVGINDYKLKRGFRQAYGTTVHKSLMELRLNRARHLLLEENHSVSQSAMAVGYGNLGDFGQAFKRRFGCLPSQLRSA